MVGFILTIALVNIGVGFAAAVYLGWRHRHLLALEMHSSQVSFPTSELFPSPAPAAAPEPALEEAAEALSQEAVDSAIDSAGSSDATRAEDSAAGPGVGSAVSVEDSASDSGESSGVVAAVDSTVGSAAGSPAAPAVDSAEDPAAGSAAGSVPDTAESSAVRSAVDSAEDLAASRAAGSTADSAADLAASPAAGSAADLASDAAGSGAVGSAGESAADSVPGKHPAPAASESEARAKGAREAAKPSPSSRARNPVESAMTDLRGHVSTYHEQVLDIDGLLRQLSQAPDAPKVEACVKTFQEVNEQYLKASGGTLESLQQPQAAEGLGTPALEGLRTAVETQAQRIESAQAAIRSIDYQGDLARVCRQMTGQTTQLAHANHALRDALDQAWATAPAAEKRSAPVEKSGGDGMLVGLANQADLETALAKWREAEAQSTKSLCMAAIDLDRFARVNERYGPRTGDRLLHALAQLLVREGNHNNVVGRISGQRFIVMFPETDLRLTTSVVERIRQIVELSQFLYGEEDIRVTVSCAVIEAKPREDLAAMLARAEAAIQEAKRYGRNRTFLYEGEYPTPVVPPNFALEERSVTL